MNGTNLYRALRELLPEAPLLVATVISVQATDGTSTVQYPGGNQQRVRGTSAAVASQVFVRNGIIENAAPALTALTIEV
ncbi:MAG: hypothetical protein EAZ30_17995 [Betaproteobacteria bacterium]|nr:MAG: hypothetical protein EAZ30_17995 [Betaproteobacteria bacterium]